MYKVFDPNTNETVRFESQAEADAFSQKLQDQIKNKERHSPIPPIELAMAKDWEVAHAFYCAKEGGEVQSLKLVEDGAPVPLPYYTHSVFNITLGCHWSRTFYYEKNGHSWHIKVKDGVVTDWYESPAMFKGREVDWVMYDVVTGEPVEYYTVDKKLMTKFDAKTDEPIVQTTMVDSQDELPEDISEALMYFKNRKSIFSWARKSYGDIVEYREKPLNLAVHVDVGEVYGKWMRRVSKLIDDQNKIALLRVMPTKVWPSFTLNVI